MKRLLSIALAMGTFTILTAQTDVVLTIQHQFSGASLQQDVEYGVDAGYTLDINRLEYYLSQIVITHDGGQQTAVEDTWILANGFEETSVLLGNFDITDVESVQFGVGVEEEVNHEDPASWGQSHPLSYQTPSMHWGWSSGYRFMALEGNTGMSMLLTYEIHALEDYNYFTAEVDADGFDVNGQLVIPLEADYAKCFDNVDVSSGLIEHGGSGDAITLLQNMVNLVFTGAAGPNSIEDQEELAVNVYPNPTMDGNLWVKLGGISNDALILVRDLTGRVVFEGSNSNQGQLQVTLPQSGIYILSIADGDQVFTKRLIYK